MSVIDNLLAMLQRGQDNALLRFSLGNEYVKTEQWSEAIRHLSEAVALDPTYSAAWKQYGKALASAERYREAADALQQGIRVAEEKGDVQAVKEMRVFLKRAHKALAASGES
jgi:tetratricopeptide (TPR) repeat protein